MGLETAPYFMRINVNVYIDFGHKKVHKKRMRFLDDIHKNQFLREK